MKRTRTVRSHDLDLSVTEHSPASAETPTVVLVHGFPDRQQVWDRLVERLPLDRLHVVTYDVRGAGASGTPDGVDGYRMEVLVDDLASVLDAVLPDGGRAHLVGHDWGSTQVWEAATVASTDPRLRGRLASFTAVCGPRLDHVSWLFDHPQGRRLALARQLAHSWYVGFFRLPVLPELAWRRGARSLARSAARREGVSWDVDAVTHDAVNGLNLYRANVSRRRTAPKPATGVPGLVVQAAGDRYLTRVLLEELDRVATDLRVVELPGGHWLQVTRADELANLVLEHVDAHR